VEAAGLANDPREVAKATPAAAAEGSSAVQPAGPPAPVAVSKFEPAVLSHRVDPPYTTVAGTVQIRFTVGFDGVPRDLAWAGGDGRLAYAAIDAIKRWRYQPAMLDGHAVESPAMVTLTINLRK
jgi:protein TonB